MESTSKKRLWDEMSNGVYNEDIRARVNGSPPSSKQRHYPARSDVNTRRWSKISENTENIIGMSFEKDGGAQRTLDRCIDDRVDCQTDENLTQNIADPPDDAETPYESLRHMTAILASNTHFQPLCNDMAGSRRSSYRNVNAPRNSPLTSVSTIQRPSSMRHWVTPRENLQTLSKVLAKDVKSHSELKMRSPEVYSSSVELKIYQESAQTEDEEFQNQPPRDIPEALGEIDLNTIINAEILDYREPSPKEEVNQAVSNENNDKVLHSPSSGSLDPIPADETADSFQYTVRREHRVHLEGFDFGMQNLEDSGWKSQLPPNPFSAMDYGKDDSVSVEFEDYATDFHDQDADVDDRTNNFTSGERRRSLDNIEKDREDDFNVGFDQGFAIGSADGNDTLTTVGDHFFAGDDSSLGFFVPESATNNSDDVEEGLHTGDSLNLPQLDSTEDLTVARAGQIATAKCSETQKALNKRRLPSIDPEICQSTLPTVAIASLVKNFTKAKLANGSMDAIIDTSENFFKNISQEMMECALRSGRKSRITDADVIEIMERQRTLDARNSIFSLSSKYLPRDLLDRVSKISPIEEESEGEESD